MKTVVGRNIYPISIGLGGERSGITWLYECTKGEDALEQGD